MKKVFRKGVSLPFGNPNHSLNTLRSLREIGKDRKNLVIGHYKIMEDMCNETIILLYVLCWTIKKLYVGKRDYPSSLFYLPINILR